jgi:hypothetical protein
VTDKPDDDPDPESYPPPQFAPAAARPGGAAPGSGPASDDTSRATAHGDRTPSWETYTPPRFAPAERSGAVPLASAGTVETSGAARAASPSVALPAEEPLLPAEYRENDLRTAIGSPPMPEQIRPQRSPPPPDDDDDDDENDDDDDGADRPRSRKTVLVIAGSLFLGLSIAALVILGRLNAAHYIVTCEAKQVVAEQGRSFPPWGTSRLGGDEWKPIKIPPSFQCVDTETEDPTELADAYRKLLVDRAEAMLTARDVVQIDDAAGMLEQALLHARSDSEAHKAARQHIQRLLGDVGYWRASGKLQEATKALTEAAKEFETAAAQLPRHVADANAWATYVRKLIDDLRAGPAGAKTTAFPPAPPAPPAPDRPPAPPGVALPVEPGAGSGSAAEPSPPQQPDAGVPTGGVLL